VEGWWNLANWGPKTLAGDFGGESVCPSVWATTLNCFYVLPVLVSEKVQGQGKGKVFCVFF
jgi:hypothetical protein